MSRPRVDWASGLVALVVLLFALKTTFGALGTFDLTFDDESIYLEAARWAGKRFLPLADSSPLYPLWYRALSVLEPDPVRLYFLNWAVLTASLPVLIYALARRSGAPLVCAAIVSIAWSVSETVLTWPYVTKFAALVLGAGALTATTVRDRRLASAVTSVALALAAYARPELALPSVVFAGAIATWSTWSWCRTLRAPLGPERRAHLLRAVLAFMVAIATPVGLRRFFGAPKQDGRAFFAFGQHYALNVVEARQLAVDPWPIWDRFAREAFPRATTIAEAARENPAAFSWHLRRNLSTLPTAVRQLLRPLPFVPRSITQGLVVVTSIVAVAGIVALALVLARRKRLASRLVAWLPLLVLLVATTGASTLLVYPREHYLLPLACLGLAALAGLSGHLTLSPRRGRSVYRVALVASLAVLLAALPTRRSSWPSLLAPAEAAPPVHENVRTIEALRRLRLRGHVNILEPDQSRAFYAGLDYTRVAQWEKLTPFWKLVHERQIGVIVLNWRLRADPRFKDDPEFVAFDEGRGPREDFELFPVAGTSAVLAVRRSVRRAPSE